MNPYESDLPIVYLRPGDLHFSGTAAQVITVLGSCLAVTMYSSRFRTGAICHGLFSRCKGKHACEGRCSEEFKYVDCSIVYMLKRFVALGVKPSEVEVKLFGGADVIGLGSGGKRTIGSQNIQAGLNILEREGLLVKVADVGGNRGRKIFFNTSTGEVLLKRLRRGRTVGDE